MKTRLALEVRGIVQGVGFRPFAARQARALGLCGTAANTPYGARVECEGERDACLELARRLQHTPPPVAVVFSVDAVELPPTGEETFRIITSEAGAPSAAVSPDIGVCADCARELFDPADRRYGYPFLNCTACGPRFTIIERVPYDRCNTAMARFPMCPACAAEYDDPDNRRFHAQPTACTACGPRAFWVEADGREVEGDPVAHFRQTIAAGGIAAVRGIGGYHLACSALDGRAVACLRRRKRRYEKPLAVMARDMDAVRELCLVSDAEEAELTGPRRPIVLLEKREGCAVAESVAPGCGRLGVMLPYTPLHLLITRDCPPLVMTSANVSDAPMPYKGSDLTRVLALCDGALTHDRPILRRMDDSVCFFAAGERRLIRRARGFAPQPEPVLTPHGGARILAMGAQLKNTFCLLRDGRAYLSGHMGDLDEAENAELFRAELPAFSELFGGDVGAVACDMHPDYAPTRAARKWAEKCGAQLMPVQHHHAHFASVLAEHGLPHAAGLIFDGAGYGGDGTSWGGELLLGSAAGSVRVGSLRPMRLPGGDAAIRQPWRTALWVVAEACGGERALELFDRFEGARQLLGLARRGALSTVSTGMGRLFDAMAVVAGVCPGSVSYEGQAAAALEQACSASAEGAYGFDIARDGDGLWRFDWRPVVRAAVEDVLRGASAGAVSARFHRALADMSVRAAQAAGEARVALSGGVFQNRLLLEGARAALVRAGFSVYANSRVPANDGGISYGQAAAAAAALAENGAG